MIALIDSTGRPIAGTNAVVLGRSDIVGSPVAAMLRKRDATVTQCHSRTTNLEQIVSYFSMMGPDSDSCRSPLILRCNVLGPRSRYPRLGHREPTFRQRRLDQAWRRRYRCWNQLYSR